MLARALLNARNQYGQDGSDQMILVVLIGVLVAQAAGGEEVASVAMAYLAGQLLLSYLVAGSAKAVSPIWRGGQAMVGILGTQGYGVPRLGTIPGRHPWAAKAPCWSMILFECGGPFLILGGSRGALALIAAGLLFHVGIASLMGLNVFLWSFAACYPAVFLVGRWVDGLWGWA